MKEKKYVQQLRPCHVHIINKVQLRSCLGSRGWAVSVTQVLLMASPLSTMYKAVKERSSASFHPLLCIMGLISSTLYVLVLHSRPATDLLFD